MDGMAKLFFSVFFCFLLFFALLLLFDPVSTEVNE